MSEASSRPLNPPTAYGDLNGELPAYVGNGLIGLRVRPIALKAGMALVSGYSGEHPVRRIEAASNAPYPLAADLCLGGAWLSDADTAVSDLQQDYDFGSGELTSRFRLKLGGRDVQVQVLTFCSRHDPTLACQEIAITPSSGGELALRATIDARGADGHLVRESRETPGEVGSAVDGTLLWKSGGGLSTCAMPFSHIVDLRERRAAYANALQALYSGAEPVAGETRSFADVEADLRDKLRALDVLIGTEGKRHSS